MPTSPKQLAYKGFESIESLRRSQGFVGRERAHPHHDPETGGAFGAVCAGWLLRARCTTAKHGRSISIHEHERLLREVRAQARTPEFKQAYPTRSSAASIISWTATNRG
jgi:DDE family transposase